MQNKKQIILSILAIFVLSVLVIGATLAYFQAQGDTTKSVSTIVKTYTTDVFSFETGSALTISLDQESFASGKGNATGSTFAKAILTANNKTNSATEHYYLYLNISNNTFTYTQNENTPEILLTITDGTNPVTNITSLTYKTVTDGKGNRISGYDITNKKGLITLFSNRKITTTSTKTENWNITVTFINYNLDQSKNAGHTFSGKVLIQKEEYELTLADICTGKALSDCVISQYTGTQGENSLYYHDSTLANGAGDNSYRYAGADPNNYICFGNDASPCPEDNLYRIIGVFDNQVKLIKATIAKSNLLGRDGAYYSDTEYEWSSLESCPSSTAYNSKGGIYQLANKSVIAKPDTMGCYEWKYSDLNTINLNTNYLNNISTTWANLIENTTWKVGGNTLGNIASSMPSVAYTNEITSPEESTTYSARIGLMYVSDYGFGASPSSWTTTLNDYDNSTATSSNWLYLGSSEWTITPSSSGNGSVYNQGSVFYLGSNGGLYNSIARDGYGSRPVLYLKDSVLFAGGEGTKDSPITLVV